MGRATLGILSALVVAMTTLGACNALTGADDLEIGSDPDDGGEGGEGSTAGTASGNPDTSGSGGAGSSSGGSGGGTSMHVCGDAVCDGGETCESCVDDCGECAPTCDDGACDGGETCQTCPSDCGPCPFCGDAACNAQETCETCATDCGACPPSCGNAVCDGGETCQTCPADCGACPPMCGDAQCNGSETCQSCAQDCGACPAMCGDAQCNGGETCQTCAQDCGQCPMCEGAGPATTPLDAEEQAFLTIINNYRAQNGLGPLAPCTSLNRAAQGHSEDMRDNDYFSHTGLDGSSPWDRACEACYDLGCGPQTAMAENIAAGNSGAAATFDQWKNSPGHNANMLGPNFTVIGIGRATGGGTYGTYWTNVFGGASEPSCN